MNEPTYYYRYEIDIWKELSGTKRELTLRTFRMDKKTPCGAWVRELAQWGTSKKRWIADNSRKKYCYPTKEQAMHSLAVRKLRAFEYAEEALLRAKIALTFIKEKDQKEGHGWINWTECEFPPTEFNMGARGQ